MKHLRYGKHTKYVKLGIQPAPLQDGLPETCLVERNGFVERIALTEDARKFRELAKSEEQAGSVSVGGLAHKLGLIPPAHE